MVSLLYTLEANPLLELLCRHPILRRGPLFSSKDSLAGFFSVFHSPGFLQVPLAVFLTIPLLNRLVAGVFSQDSTRKIALRALKTAGLGCGKGRGVEWWEKSALLVVFVRVWKRFWRP